MSKKKIIAWALIFCVFAIMLFIELGQDESINTQLPEEEVIYLSYDQEPPFMQAPVIDALEPVVEASPDLGSLAIPSVIINKPAIKSPVTEKISEIESTTHAQQQNDLAFKIFQGQRFTAVLTHAIHSDLPGMVVAEVSQNIYGYQSYIPLLPKGTRLIGNYTNQLKVGDTRLYISWDRAITPNGIDIQLGSLATDRLGQTGLTGDVDTHFWQTFGTSSLLSVMAVGASNLSEEQGELSNQYQQGVTESLMDTSTLLLEDRIARKPTVHIPQGEIIHVMVAQDLDFSQVLQKTQHIPIF